MSTWAVGFVGMEMSASVYNVTHIFCLCTADEVVWVDTDSVVAGVAYYWWEVIVGKEE